MNAFPLSLVEQSMPVPHCFGAKWAVGWSWEGRQGWDMLCSSVSAGDQSHHCRVALVPARLPRASLHVSFQSLSSLDSVPWSIMPSSEAQAWFPVGTGDLDGNPARNAVPSHLSGNPGKRRAPLGVHLLQKYNLLTLSTDTDASQTVLVAFHYSNSLAGWLLKLNQFTVVGVAIQAFLWKGANYVPWGNKGALKFRVVHCFLMML